MITSPIFGQSPATCGSASEPTLKIRAGISSSDDCVRSAQCWIATLVLCQKRRVLSQSPLSKHPAYERSRYWRGQYLGHIFHELGSWRFKRSGAELFHFKRIIFNWGKLFVELRIMFMQGVPPMLIWSVIRLPTTYEPEHALPCIPNTVP